MLSHNIKALIMGLSPEDKESLREFLDHDHELSRFMGTAGVTFGCASGDGSWINLCFFPESGKDSIGGYIALNVYDKNTGREIKTHHQLEDIKRMVSVLQLAVEKMEEDCSG